ncbi:ATP-binding protein [Streptomyces sp. NPDC020742]|uniref:ATP-binding protein n=1 Tax=unclassified Streptomyces TaxID=2593676 RepID=UPI0033E8BD06
MSLPVTRRIARAALLVAAGAAPVVAAAGSASAAELPVKAPDLGGLTAPLDSQNTSKTLDRTAQQGVGLINEAGGKAATKLAPALVETAGPVVKKAMPLTRGAVDRAEGVARPVAKHGISASSPLDAVTGLVGAPQGPLGQVPGGLLGGLPLGGR